MELGAIPACEQVLAVGFTGLESDRARVLQQELALREWECWLSEKETDVSSRDTALAAREHVVAIREESMCWEAAAAATAGERVAAAQREARDAATAAALDAAAKVKDARASCARPTAELRRRRRLPGWRRSWLMPFAPASNRRRPHSAANFVSWLTARGP